MKKFYTLAIIAVLGIIAPKANAQVNVNVNMQPAWAPVGNTSTSFYFIPEINVYFDVVRRKFIYPNGNRWIYVNQLPAAI